MSDRSRYALRWAREIPTMLHNGRVDRIGHHVALLISTWANNDGTNAFMSLDTLAECAHATLAETHAAVQRLEALGYVMPAVATNGAAGWALPISRQHETDTVSLARAERNREAARERKRRQRQREQGSGHAEVDRDVTPECGVTEQFVTDDLGVTRADVTHDLGVSHAQLGVTSAGHSPIPPLTSIKNYLHKDAGAEHPAAAVAAETDLDTPNGTLFGAVPDKPAKAPVPAVDFTEDFDAWWALYPRKADRKPALIAYEKARLGKAVRDNRKRRPVSAEQLLRATPLFAAQMRQESREAKHIPMGATWLNKDGWEDFGPAEAPQRPTVDHLRATANAVEAARLLRLAWTEPSQHPNDTTPRDQFIRNARVAFIDRHADELAALLTRNAS